MPTEPAEVPVWADTETPATPSAGQQNAGWSTIPIPSYDTFDWLGKWTGRWITWLKAWYAVQHAASGKHTKVTYEAVRTVTIPLGSPDKGGWVAVDATLDAPVYNYAATPPNTGLAAGLKACSLARLIDLPIGPDDASAADQWVITDLKITYKRVGTGGNTFQWALYSTLADGTGAPIAEKAGALTSATWTVATVSCAAPVNATVNPARRYYAMIFLLQGAGAAAAEVVFSNVDVVCTRAKLE